MPPDVSTSHLLTWDSSWAARSEDPAIYIFLTLCAVLLILIWRERRLRAHRRG